MTRSHVAFGPSYILIALVRGPSQTHVLAWTDARTCKDGCTYLREGLHVLAGTVARTCVEGHYVLPDFASNACSLCLKRMSSLPQTLSSAPANVIIRSCKRYHPRLQTLSSAPANVCLRFWLFLPRDDEMYGLPLAPWISSLIGLFVWGRRKDVCNISIAGGRSLTCILCGEQNLHKWQSSRNFVPYYIYKKKYIWIHSNSFAV